MALESVLDLRHFPLVVVDLPARIDLAYADALDASHKALFARGARYVSFTDARRVASLPDALTRKRLGEWAKGQEPILQRLQVANALVVGSSMVRAGLSAIHWVAPPPVPTAVETDPVEAAAFITRKAEAAGLLIPAAGLSWLRGMARTA